MNILIKSDFWLGFIVLVGGFWTYCQSTGFDRYSDQYPQFLSVVHIVLGLGLILNALREREDRSDSLKRLFEEMRGPLMVASIFLGWGGLLLLSTGYLLSSLIMLPAVLYALGYQKPRQLIFVTTCIVAVVFILFYVIFEVPLPLNTLLEQIIN